MPEIEYIKSAWQILFFVWHSYIHRTAKLPWGGGNGKYLLFYTMSWFIVVGLGGPYPKTTDQVPQWVLQWHSDRLLVQPPFSNYVSLQMVSVKWRVHSWESVRLSSRLMAAWRSFTSTPPPLLPPEDCWGLLLLLIDFCVVNEWLPYLTSCWMPVIY